MAEQLDIEAMLHRFRERARAVRQRGLPPVEGPERKRFLDQARTDYMDYAIIGDAKATLEGGVLTLTVDLRPGPAETGQPPGAGAASQEGGAPAGSNRAGTGQAGPPSPLTGATGAAAPSRESSRVGDSPAAT